MILEQQSADEVVAWGEHGRVLAAQFFGPNCLADARDAHPGAEEDHSWSADDDGDRGPSEAECRRHERQQMGFTG